MLVGIVSSSVLPVEKCKLKDSSCLIQAFQKAMPIFMSGMPDVGVEILDVMKMDEVNFDLAGLKFGLKDGRLQGLKNSIVDNVKWDLEKRENGNIFSP
ncbi:unnamed protein product [Parnassius apollo]|uniref:(apollo) hypothetical protein n=1 Tax=Parnassius apollo TaxID=110799 RepID=A0A8S3XKB9_PARAO|nr:unnamed protein product [Parnassius apollo]